MGSYRLSKVRELIREEASLIIQNELKDPRIGFVTVTDVKLSSDLRYAQIFVSILEDKEKRKQTLEGLKSATPYIRKEIGKRIKLRYAPEIRITFDKSLESKTKLIKLLGSLH
ncbi:MAG: ribosome-binding factor A [Armatimonadetes bacterium CG07_land_8_20_14_0_80_40_9]|nr:MAG: ribosome-binding factor A [Armatimonadetes bacterium CG07_land_8_20_14_0_80_40_9]